MSAGNHSTTPSPGHELRDVAFRPIVGAAVAVMLALVITLVGMAKLFDVLAAREARRSQPPNPLAASAGRREPPAPRLQTAPVQDLQQLRAAEQTALDSYGWVDRQAGITHIPITRAMELLVQRQTEAAELPAAGSAVKPAPKERRR